MLLMWEVWGSRKCREVSGLGSIISYKKNNPYIVLDFYHEIVHVY